MKLEVVVVPVFDVDKAKDFYQALGWRLDADFVTGADFRVVQLTPPGSARSVIFGTGLTSAVPGSAQGLQLVVTDIDAARAKLADRGAEVSEVFHDAGRVFHHAGTQGRVSGPGAGSPELRLVRVVRRPGRQRMVRPGGHHPPSGPVTGSSPVTAGRQVLAEQETPMQVTYDSAADLAEALRRAAAAHGKHEEQLGHPDPDRRDQLRHTLPIRRVGGGRRRRARRAPDDQHRRHRRDLRHRRRPAAHLRLRRIT